MNINVVFDNRIAVHRRGNISENPKDVWNMRQDGDDGCKFHIPSIRKYT